MARHSPGAVAAVERQQAAGALDREHPGRRGGRADVQETAAAVLGLEPLPAVDPDAGAALDPVGRRAGNAERLGHRGGEQVTGPGRHHVGSGADHVDGARAQVHDHRVGPGPGRGQRAQPGGGRLGQRDVHRDAEQARQLRRGRPGAWRGRGRRPAPPGRGCPAGRWRPRPPRRGPPRTGRPPRPPQAVPNARTAPTGQPVSRAQAARSGSRPPPAAPSTARPARRRAAAGGRWPAGPPPRWSGRARAGSPSRRHQPRAHRGRAAAPAPPGRPAASAGGRAGAPRPRAAGRPPRRPRPPGR